MASTKMTPEQVEAAVNALPISPKTKQSIISDLPTKGTIDSYKFTQALIGILRTSKEPQDATFTMDFGKELKKQGLDPEMPISDLEYMAAAIVGVGVALAAPAVAPGLIPASGSIVPTIWSTATLAQQAVAVTATAVPVASYGYAAIDEEQQAQKLADRNADTTAAAKPKTPAEAAQAAAEGTATYKVTSVDASTGVETEVPLSEQMAQELAKITGGLDGGNTYTQRDQAYFTQVGFDPFNPQQLETTGGQTPDTKGIFFNSSKIAPNDPRMKDPNFREFVATHPDYRNNKYYSYRESLNVPSMMNEQEVMATSKKLWEAGFLQIDGYDFTKPFESQWTGDRYDPGFRRAWGAMLTASLADPSKSATQITEERRKARAHWLEEQRRDAYEAKTKDALRSLNLPDPATLSETAEGKMQELLGRNPTPDEREHLMMMMSSQIGAQAKQIVEGDGTQPVTSMDFGARMEDAIEAEHGAEYGAARVSDAFDMFKSLLGGY